MLQAVNTCSLRSIMLRYFFIISLLWFLLSPIADADVVKPALIEITANTNETVTIEVRASIEALLTGINSQYKNTQDAPQTMAAAYDTLRELPPDALRAEFAGFEQRFLQAITLQADDTTIPLSLSNVAIPPRGYTKVPRISVLTLTGKLPRYHQQLQWYYPQVFGENVVRVRQVDEATEAWHWSEHQWIRKDEASKPFVLDQLFTKTPFWQVVGSYIIIGFEHIIPMGLDHILFIIGIFLLSLRWQPLLAQVTMFTVAHTITLGLAMAGVINLPAAIVEPLIALSIAYIAIENMFSNQLAKHRLILVFVLGLLHGVGFAGALSDFGMPQDAFINGLISLNIGV
ncbi:MAG TPA: HupE/UreJ family protein, partial [Thiothrix sp.]|nr:HupE/UreJ family protein [Thiothrix sp.]